MKRILIVTACIVVTVGIILGLRYYRWIKNPNTQQADNNTILILPGSSYEDLFQMLTVQGILIHPNSFSWVAKRMRFGDAGIKPGRYIITPGISNYALIQKLRLGQQDAVSLIINSASSIESLAGSIGRQLQIDSFDFQQYLINSYIPETMYTNETILCAFIPNTYEVWWNITPAKLMERMELEHSRFWNSDRRALAAKLSMTTEEVYTLASIVEGETQAQDEKATIAGVYLNRLRKNIPLQADPTIRFALHDPGVRRILFKHLEIDSPYNTYRYTGLPPGPITMPSIRSIDAVLRAEDHDYIFFCAKPGYEGRHVFSRTLSAHMQNARAYQTWLDKEGIR